ncbi:MAG: NUDIX domain-containing protein [Planctomycetota bacterium]|nr:NUDIX domain-containing protein [Planctomycetota bacterium]
MQSPAVEPSGHRDAVFGLVEREGRLLLVCNPRVIGGQRQDTWDLPGGAVQGGESLAAALVREWREETGLSADVRDLLLVVDGEKRTAEGALLYTWRAFTFRVASEGPPTPGAGIVEASWVPWREALGRLDAPYHDPLRQRIEAACEPGRRPEGTPAARYSRLVWRDAPRGPDALPDLGPRRLLVIAAAAAVGDRDLLGRELDAAVAAGERPARLVETLLQIVPYAGYPRAITAFGILRARLPEAPASHEAETDRETSAARGRAAFEAVYGTTAGAVQRGLAALDPVLARWTLEHAYGRVLAREGTLSLLEREYLGVSILTALGGLGDPLLGHMRACVRLGSSQQGVAAAIACVPASVGEGRRHEARALLARLDPSPPA